MNQRSQLELYNQVKLVLELYNQVISFYPLSLSFTQFYLLSYKPENKIKNKVVTLPPLSLIRFYPFSSSFTLFYPILFPSVTNKTKKENLVLELQSSCSFSFSTLFYPILGCLTSPNAVSAP